MPIRRENHRAEDIRSCWNWYDFQISWLCGRRLGDENSPFHDYYQSALKPWRMDRRSSNGVVGDFGSHIFDMIQFRMSPVREISASVVTRRPVEYAESLAESLSAVIRLENGAHVTLSHGDHDDEKPVEIDGAHHMTRDITEVFVESIQNDTNPVPAFAGGLSVQRIIDGALESHVTGSRGLESVYQIVFFDAIVLKNRGVEDIRIAAVDGLTGFPEAIRTVSPATFRLSPGFASNWLSCAENAEGYPRPGARALYSSTGAR